jgi:hypothetical protein
MQKEPLTVTVKNYAAKIKDLAEEAEAKAKDLSSEAYDSIRTQLEAVLTTLTKDVKSDESAVKTDAAATDQAAPVAPTAPVEPTEAATPAETAPTDSAPAEGSEATPSA